MRATCATATTESRDTKILDGATRAAGDFLGPETMTVILADFQASSRLDCGRRALSSSSALRVPESLSVQLNHLRECFGM